MLFSSLCNLKLWNKYVIQYMYNEVWSFWSVTIFAKDCDHYG